MVNRKRGARDPKTIRVFMAAPRDLVVERRAVRDTIEQSNVRSGDEMGVQFVLLGSEDSVPQAGQPPQNGMREGIDACDVFVLVLYRRWGQDVSHAGACTSGTEIEFHLALDRFQQTGTPEILVFFKNLDIASMADPGPQLSRVLQFRRFLEGLREIRYATFDDIKEFQAALAEKLLAYASGALSSADVAHDPIRLPDECVHAVERAWAEAQRLAEWLETHQPARAPAAQRAEQELILALRATAAQQAEQELMLALRAAAAAAQGHVEEAQQAFAHATEETVNLSVLSLAFEFYCCIGKLDVAQELLNRSLVLGGRDQETPETATSCASLGLIYEGRGDLKQAEAMFLQALGIDERLGHQDALARDYDNLGRIYERRGELHRTEEMLLKTLAIDEQQGQEAGMAGDYSRLGLIYGARGAWDRAEEMLRKAVAIDERLDRQEALASDFSSLGLIYRMRGQVPETRQLWLQARDIYAAIGLQELAGKLQNWLDNLPSTQKGSNHGSVGGRGPLS